MKPVFCLHQLNEKKVQILVKKNEKYTMTEFTYEYLVKTSK
jgi:hypothetical protein